MLRRSIIKSVSKKLSAYWWCQVGGWSFNAIANLINGIFNPYSWSYHNLSLNIFFFRLFIISLLGIMLTHLMRSTIIRFNILQKKLYYQVIFILIITLMFSIAYSFSTVWIFKILGLLTSNEVILSFSSSYGAIFYSFLVLLIWNLIYFSYQYLEKSRKEEIKKISFENELKIQSLESEKKNIQLQREAIEHEIKTIVVTQEEERKRISRDLHDDVGTKLSAVNLFLSTLYERATRINDDEIKLLAQSSKEVIKDTMTDVRQLLRNLSPTVLEEFGYTAAVERLVSKINETKQIHFNLEMHLPELQLSKDDELVFYRITQELINNVLKHAEAKHVSLRIEKCDEKILLAITDDGKGFDVEAHKDGYGLHNLETRTRLMQGTIKIDSHPGKGTNVLIEIPTSIHDRV